MGKNHEKWSVLTCPCKFLVFLFVFTFWAGAIAMLALGGLCYTQRGVGYEYCVAIGDPGRAGLVIAGSLLLFLGIVYLVVHIFCCIVTCGVCCNMCK